ncbi:MAG: PEP-CTERM sorting domain-containing protein [Phycisphaerae bacterium]|nr:PEP-CTERM sorting domain-containing protein [Phycisphaerae bacterium]
MKKLILTSLCVLFFAGTALADWNPGDSYKMHYPQLPDPTGWDVQANDPELADDWLCTGTGPVSDIHIWYSVFGDEYSAILQGGVVRIYSDSPDPDDDGPLFSHPDKKLWEWVFSIDDPRVSSRLYGTGDQGWYNPRNEEVYANNHDNIYQLNIVDIPDPFEQKEGEVYWLALQLNATFAMGWKTSLDHWNDDAVWSNGTIGGPWNELCDPYTGQSLDMAFVITPEPATVALLGLGALSLIRKKRA